MNHDITPCKGGNCPRKKYCYRYQALKELQKLHKETCVPMFENPDVCKYQDYKYFMKGDNR